MKILQVKNLSKSFGNKNVIKDVSFEIEKGKIVGLLGKNGSGKTTILKIINDLLTIDKGEILINGEKVGEKSKAMVSYLPERSYLDRSWTVKQIFTFFEEFYSDFDRNKAEKLLEDLGLDIDAKISKMSKGMVEKVQLILVMSRNAQLYVLDEPLGGVDPATREYILNTILSNFNENASLLITTHLVSDVEKIFDQVLVINNGEIVLSGDADQLRDENNASINEIFIKTVK